jgi:hypothetical protein
MSLAFLNRCGFRATSTGTGSFVVASALTGMQTPAQATGPAVVNATTYRYFAQSDDLTQWEYGTGVYTTGDVTLTRATVYDNSSGGTTALSFSAAPRVYMGAPLAYDMNITAARYLALTNFDPITTAATLDAANDPHLQQAVLVNTSFTSMDFTNCISLKYLYIDQSTELTALSLGGNSNLENLICLSTSITTADLSDCSALTLVQFNGNPSLATLSSPATPAAIEFFICTGAALDEASVDDALVACDNGGFSGGAFDSSGGTSASPGAAGLAAATSLGGKGWDVNFN